MSAYTPGPWEVFPSEWDSTLYVMPEGQWEGRGGPDTVAVIQSKFMHGEANARLIAAATDLLEALRDLMPEFESRIGDFENAEWHDCWNKAVAAIAKATGEQS